MQFITSTLWPVLLVLFISSVTASPSYLWPRSLSSRSLHKRGLPGAVYICTGNNFQGNCGWNQPSTQCRIVGTGKFAPKSIGPDPGGFCNLYTSGDCTGNQIQTLRFPGAGNGFPDNLGSLQCFSEGTSNVAEQAIGTASFNRDDKRLAGGVGSMERKRLKEQIEAMEKDGFSEGMIGLKKKMYY
ncbi:hypothetical protein B0J11DRAFT_72473 [Dendryphion nanum]|uniref:Uncharacterized protein n=1 Tax=Dendryphion nanum TaxID=256645 RepID=A0A9P9IHX5_9PLEO|nr:hypothetical protein B0J11DRAFT_72473 [Dendryphion nanum]